ncbi:MAG: septum formation initiator family protein [bacterium]|nr:MAG: septum formation initiator family protein [bacterium]
MKSLWGQSSRYLRIKRSNFDINPKVARLLLVIVLLLIGAIFIAGDVGLWNLWTAQRRLNRIREEISVLEQENASLKAEIELLRNDPFAIEKVARERYGYLRPGDKVYRIITLPTEHGSDKSSSTSLDSDAKNP